MLTGNTLVDSEQAVGRLRRDFPDAIAGEMEGAGVYEAATLDDKPDWIMVKAISDWGYRKTDGDQQLAAPAARLQSGTSLCTTSKSPPYSRACARRTRVSSAR